MLLFQKYLTNIDYDNTLLMKAKAHLLLFLAYSFDAAITKNLVKIIPDEWKERHDYLSSNT